MLKIKLLQILNIVKLLKYNPYFGFINGHSYVSKLEVKRILKLIMNPEEEDEKLSENFSDIICYL